jgi:hypothetical protein
MYGGRDLEPLLKHGLLTLDTDVLGPLDETTQITLWLDILTYREEGNKNK